MQEKREIPEKLLYARVRAWAWEARCRAVAVPISTGFVRRDATQADADLPLDWSTLDLLTLALDLADDDELRGLLVQARTQAINLLTR